MSLLAAVERVAQKYRLSPREIEVALNCVEGMTNSDIAQDLRVSAETIKFHLGNIFMKVGVNRRAQLIRLVLLPEVEIESREVAADKQ